MKVHLSMIRKFWWLMTRTSSSVASNFCPSLSVVVVTFQHFFNSFSFLRPEKGPGAWLIQPLTFSPFPAYSRLPTCKMTKCWCLARVTTTRIGIGFRISPIYNVFFTRLAPGWKAQSNLNFQEGSHNNGQIIRWPCRLEAKVRLA